MSEPKETAAQVEEVVPGVWHWRVHDDRIDFVSAAHAVVADEGAVLIDPLPLAEDALASLGPVAAICLTSSVHQRSAWRLRRDLGVKVYAPALSQEIDEEPDVRYGEGDPLPGGLSAVFTPGAGTTQHTLLRPGEPAVAFVPDLLVRPPGAPVMLLPADYAHDFEELKRSVEKLAGLPFEVLCLAHGEPVLEGAKDAIRSALAA